MGRRAVFLRDGAFRVAARRAGFRAAFLAAFRTGFLAFFRAAAFFGPAFFFGAAFFPAGFFAGAGLDGAAGAMGRITGGGGGGGGGVEDGIGSIQPPDSQVSELRNAAMLASSGCSVAAGSAAEGALRRLRE